MPDTLSALKLLIDLIGQRFSHSVNILADWQVTVEINHKRRKVSESVALSELVILQKRDMNREQ